jgi:branched-chain amino acid transport system substrate-binding protein
MKISGFTHEEERRVRSCAASALLIAALAVGAISCSVGRPIVIGLAGSFSGRNSDLAVSGRKAVELFVRKANEAGGVRGRRLELAMQDFASNPASVVSADAQLLRLGAVVVVGHFTSAEAVAALGFANRERIVIVSPTASAESLGGKDDYFFRTVMSSRYDPLALAADMAAKGRRRLLVIEVNQNRPYAETYTLSLAKSVEIADDISCASLGDFDYGRALRARTDAALVIASSIDAGSIAQELRLRGFAKPLYLSGFAATNSEAIIAGGGSAVEGAWFVHQIDLGDPALAPLAAEFHSIYGIAPDYAAIEAWDAMCLIKTVLEAGGLDRRAFYEIIHKTRSFQGAADLISLDQYGDAHRPLYIRVIKDHKIVTLGRFE